MRNKTLCLLLAAILLFTYVIVSGSAVNAQENFFWYGNVYSATGAPTVTPTLVSGTEYRIVASTVFWYNYSAGLQADAQYYTTNSTGWNWVNYYPAPNGHSFLQINGGDVNWGSFSNGNTNHTYSIMYIGEGAPISFQIYDWVDQDFSNNNCHIEVSIYEEQSVTSSSTPVVPTTIPPSSLIVTPSPTAASLDTQPTPTTSTQPTTTAQPESTTKQPITMPIIIYAVIALVILLIAVAASLLILRKRKKKT